MNRRPAGAFAQGKINVAAQGERGGSHPDRADLKAPGRAVVAHSGFEGYASQVGMVTELRGAQRAPYNRVRRRSGDHKPCLRGARKPVSEPGEPRQRGDGRARFDAQVQQRGGERLHGPRRLQLRVRELKIDGADHQAVFTGQHARGEAFQCFAPAIVCQFACPPGGELDLVGQRRIAAYTRFPPGEADR
ncbi:MAG: hypothetical protein IANPNBLG_01257 [Bryobacteraceae bacterium]|nr:hypothetical protein [Bryobacteraceae bacterium]